uniref:GH18 domain-containing protein n=1 Tax=Leersia perrieri TaxID=77586 RepID=A0A0D9XVM4_9ORYZ
MASQQQRRRSSPTILAAILLLSFLATANLAGAITRAGRRRNVVVFWGGSKDEGSLRSTCDSGLYNIVIIPFYSLFGHGRYWDDLSGHDLRHIGADITHCQFKAVYILLSIGGGDGKDYSLPPSKSAADVADHLYNSFLGGSRPVVPVNGIDFFIDRGQPDHYYEIAKRIDEDTRNWRDPIGFKLTATVSCAYDDSDPRMKKALDTYLFRRVHVRFYDDPTCSYNHAGLAGVMTQWNRWSASYPYNGKMYLGLAAANLTEKNDMVAVGELHRKLLPAVQKTDTYGGVMLWNSYYDSITHYGRYVSKWA